MVIGELLTGEPMDSSYIVHSTLYIRTQGTHLFSNLNGNPKPVLIFIGAYRSPLVFDVSMLKYEKAKVTKVYL